MKNKVNSIGKVLIFYLLKGATILGIGIFLVVAMNNRVPVDFVYAEPVFGPLEPFGPAMQAPDKEPFWISPADGVVTSAFGSRWGREHQGIDIGAEEGSAILAAKDGSVVYADWAEGYGNYLILDHGNGFTTAYAHCSSLLVCDGDWVTQGQPIAKVGSTGNSTGPHLHFEMQKDGVFLNPQEYGLY